MRILFVPFWSQQNKKNGLFTLQSDSAVRFFCYAATHLPDAVVALPYPTYCDDPPPYNPRVVHVPSGPRSNLARRYHWDAEWLASLDYDWFVTTHEYLPIPLRAIHPEAKIAVEGPCNLDAYGGSGTLFQEALSVSDVAFCGSKTLEGRARDLGANSTSLWMFGYDPKDVVPRNKTRTHSVVFPARISATGYTNHELMRRAWPSAVFCDPTNAEGNAVPRKEYLDSLHRSRVVVGLTDNGYGGWAFVEAVACGACPVALRCPGYEELLPPNWPYFCDATEGSLQSTIQRALDGGLLAVDQGLLNEVSRRVRIRSYTAALEEVKRCLYS